MRRAVNWFLDRFTSFQRELIILALCLILWAVGCCVFFGAGRT